MDNVENAISEPLDFKIFLGEHAPRPPYILQAFAIHFQVPHLKIHSIVRDSGVQDSPPCVSTPMG